MNKIIKDYLGLEIPIWFQSRKNLFLLFCLDFIIFILIKTYGIGKQINTQSITITIIFSLLWCLISYINGKYSYFKNNYSLIIKIIRLINSNLISLTLIYLLDKLIIIYYPFIVPFGRNKIFLLGIISFCLQFIKLYFYKVNIKKKKLYILGLKDEIDSFKKILKTFPIFKNIEFLDFLNCKQQSLKKKTILILNEELGDKYIYGNIINYDLQIFTPFNWCEKFLDRIPSKYLSDKEYQKPYWIIESDNFQSRLKRFGDVTISLLLMIFSSPLIIIFGSLIWFEDKGPIFYSQIRTGLNGKEFKLTKLRTMKQQSEKSGPVWASKFDKRITKIGVFLRRTRIDELPQLLSVLLGDMSLIGPRPERPEIEITLKKNIPHYELRKIIKPGLSGWAQVNYPYGASIEDSEIKLSYELFYIRNQSFLLDILILIKTIKLVLMMRGSKPKK